MKLLRIRKGPKNSLFWRMNNNLHQLKSLKLPSWLNNLRRPFWLNNLKRFNRFTSIKPDWWLSNLKPLCLSNSHLHLSWLSNLKRPSWINSFQIHFLLSNLPLQNLEENLHSQKSLISPQSQIQKADQHANKKMTRHFTQASRRKSVKFSQIAS